MSTIKVDTVRPVTTDASLTLQGDSSGSGVTGITIDSAGDVTINNGTLGSGVSIQGFTGMIASFAMSSAPTGWLACDGSAISRTTYADLFTAISTTWGVGDGSTTFNLPDLRGEFLRGWDNSAGNDPDAGSRTGGDVVGSSQLSEFGSHNHSPYRGRAGTSGTQLRAHVVGGANTATITGITDSPLTTDGGNETRPRNKYVQYCIKF